MNEDSFESLEQHLSRHRRPEAPDELRAPVLAAIHRQLKWQRWERRLFRTAAALLLIGVGLNWSVNLRDERTRPAGVNIAARREAIIDVAAAVARGTDADTGSRIAQHLTALSGAMLSPQELMSMERAIQRRIKTGSASRKEG